MENIHTDVRNQRVKKMFAYAPKNEGDLTNKGSLTHFSCICLCLLCIFKVNSW